MVMKLKVLQEVDDILKEIKEHQTTLELQRKMYEEDLRIVKDRYQKSMEYVKQQIEQADKRLKNILKSKRSVIFDDCDYINVKNGSVWYRVKTAVKKIRNLTVEMLEELGYVDGIRIEKSVNWTAIEQWDDDKLAVIGTERITKEEYGYDV